jgi:phage FluMu protein Com
MKRCSTALFRCVQCFAMLVDVIGKDGRITQACPRCFKLRLVDIVRQLHEMEST